MSPRAILFTLAVILAALFINFAPYFGAVQARDIRICDRHAEFGITEDECVFYERPLRYIPETIFEAPTDAFEKWHAFGETMANWFGMPDNIIKLYRVLFWTGVYNTCAIFTVLIMIGVFLLWMHSAGPDHISPDDNIDGSDSIL